MKGEKNKKSRGLIINSVLSEDITAKAQINPLRLLLLPLFR